ncbi:AAA domain-containing protein [Micromonospora pattaloongensis]|uniref:AAA domain-containing protein n=1 Tax=Micromonospora pattaloongensis TaxID=405436 RepID=A0A1H3QXP4_9ACTN|nr:AAA domain-containing protein [Micromonospora pattaloongensis]
MRFVSFVADVDVAVTLARHELEGYGDRLDVRRVSAFDIAAGATSVTYLEEHYRSVPHLIEFSARRFYRDRIALMTRHPRTERADAIDVVRLDTSAVQGGVNRAEVDAVVGIVRELAERDAADIGVITPFRDQADALESALLAAFPVEEIERLRLRTGTVHAFQGSEADTVVVSLGLADDDSPARQRFVSDRHLFNVMVTRARERLVVVTSLRDSSGIVGDYLGYASVLPAGVEHPPGEGPDWPARLGARLASHGLTVRVDYPVGRWSVDLCVGDGDSAVGLICGVHPEGVAAHLERHRALRRMGWTLRDAFASRWAQDPVRASLELAHELRVVPAVSRA